MLVFKEESHELQLFYIFKLNSLLTTTNPPPKHETTNCISSVKEGKVLIKGWSTDILEMNCRDCILKRCMHNRYYSYIIFLILGVQTSCVDQVSLIHYTELFLIDKSVSQL